jgi:hypothetical protein
LDEQEGASAEELINRKFQVKPFLYLEAGWRTFQRYPIGFLSFALLFTVLSQSLPLLTPLLGQFLSLVVQIIMLAGIAMVVWKLQRHDRALFMDFFPDWGTTGRLLLCTVLGLLLIGLGFVLFVLPGIYLLVGYSFSYMLIADRGLGVWEALETSRRVVNKNWWGVFGLTIMMLLLIAAGMLMGGIVFGLPLGAFLAGYSTSINLADLPFMPSGSTGQVNRGMLLGVLSGMMMGAGCGTALVGCMLGVAYADIFGSTTGQADAGACEASQVDLKSNPTHNFPQTDPELASHPLSPEAEPKE